MGDTDNLNVKFSDQLQTGEIQRVTATWGMVRFQRNYWRETQIHLRTNMQGFFAMMLMLKKKKKKKNMDHPFF